MSQLGRQWADEELTAFYQHFHNTTSQDWAKVCEWAGGGPVWPPCTLTSMLPACPPHTHACPSMPAHSLILHCCCDVCLHTSPCLQLAELLPGREALDCENLFAQYQTFLSLPYSSGLQAAFVAMVKDVYKNKLEEEATKPAVRGGGCACVRAAALSGARAAKGQRQLACTCGMALVTGKLVAARRHGCRVNHEVACTCPLCMPCHKRLCLL